MGIFESLTPGQQSLIKKHLELVIEANEHINLTRIDTFEEGMLLHVEDSLTGVEELNHAPEGFYGDLGTGAGFPGIPLAIATGRQTALIDARKKKIETIGVMVGKLGLSSQVETYAGRAELLARKQSGQYAVLTARALSQLPVLLELASPLLQEDGVLICYKSQLTSEELADAQSIKKLVGMKLESDREFLLGNMYKRRILMFRKYANPKMKLPRLEGQAQKDPLSNHVAEKDSR